MNLAEHLLRDVDHSRQRHGVSMRCGLEESGKAAQLESPPAVTRLGDDHGGRGRLVHGDDGLGRGRLREVHSRGVLFERPCRNMKVTESAAAAAMSTECPGGFAPARFLEPGLVAVPGGRVVKSDETDDRRIEADLVDDAAHDATEDGVDALGGAHGCA